MEPHRPRHHDPFLRLALTMLLALCGGGSGLARAAAVLAPPGP
ncbi:MAG: hypothetical protein WCO00_03030 [Rhodospirillaceae bacterium]